MGRKKKGTGDIATQTEIKNNAHQFGIDGEKFCFDTRAREKMRTIIAQPEVNSKQEKPVEKVKNLDQLRSEARKLFEQLKEIRNNIFYSDKLKGKFGTELIRLANELTDVINKRQIG